MCVWHSWQAFHTNIWYIIRLSCMFRWIYIMYQWNSFDRSGNDSLFLVCKRNSWQIIVLQMFYKSVHILYSTEIAKMISQYLNSENIILFLSPSSPFISVFFFFYECAVWPLTTWPCHVNIHYESLVRFSNTEDVMGGQIFSPIWIYEFDVSIVDLRVPYLGREDSIARNNLGGRKTYRKFVVSGDITKIKNNVSFEFGFSEQMFAKQYVYLRQRWKCIREKTAMKVDMFQRQPYW